ncbi:OmpH family outer membrane protein [Polyangium mundeleinium]|uniref:OmpH family outer membrane protein n=1 Tax=Polyangium mundeleinium TaxID=2995306 RepID=A0ABT5ESJ0_9BACT|nr:OmpH family outer membrane protein [Polyangium mundeleinium]MDC0744329.1 OmpH family outer membrane protein [Polyangium mundeleinium]
MNPRRSSWLQGLRAPVLAAALVAGVGGFFAAEETAAAQSKIAVIDVRRAMLETEKGLRVQATLKKLFDSRQVELDAKQQKLQAEKEALEKDAQNKKVSQDQLQRRFEALQKQAADLQAIAMEYQREMQRKETELTTPIYQEIIGIVRRIAAQDGFEIILEKTAVPYMRADLEITDRAIQMYNSAQAGGDAGKPPATQPGKPAAPAAPATAPAPAPKKK